MGRFFVYRIMRKWTCLFDRIVRLFPSEGIQFTSAAIRQWRKLTPSTRSQIDSRLKTFAETGVGDVKALKGVAGMRLRSGDWRVLFTVEGNIITIHAVGHRRDIYD